MDFQSKTLNTDLKDKIQSCAYDDPKMHKIPFPLDFSALCLIFRAANEFHRFFYEAHNLIHWNLNFRCILSSKCKTAFKYKIKMWHAIKNVYFSFLWLILIWIIKSKQSQSIAQPKVWPYYMHLTIRIKWNWKLLFN